MKNSCVYVYKYWRHMQNQELLTITALNSLVPILNKCCWVKQFQENHLIITEPALIKHLCLARSSERSLALRSSFNPSNCTGSWVGVRVGTSAQSIYSWPHSWVGLFHPEESPFCNLCKDYHGRRGALPLQRQVRPSLSSESAGGLEMGCLTLSS